MGLRLLALLGKPRCRFLWQVKLGVIRSLKPMLSLVLPNDDLREQVYDYIPLLLAEYQGSLEPLFITQVRLDAAPGREAQEIWGFWASCGGWRCSRPNMCP